MPKLIYLDNAATTKVDDDIFNEYKRLNDVMFANSSAIHGFGVSALRELDKAKEAMLSSLKLNDYKVVITANATESNNMFLKGAALKYKNRGKHIITSMVEHPSVMETIKQLESEFGYEVTYLPVDRTGKIRLEDLEKAMRNDTIIVSIMAVNNEVGAINDCKGISEIVHKYPKAIYHSDLTQAVGKLSLDFSIFDAMSFSGHKIHTFKGTGALILKKKIDLIPLHSGGGQEDGLRSGTVDVPGAICLTKALDKEIKSIKERYTYISTLRDMLKDYILSNPNEYVANSFDDGLPYVYNFSLLNKKASVVVEALSERNIYVSTKSACHSKGEKGSSVVLAMTDDTALADNAIRVSFDASNTKEDIEELISNLDNIVKEIKDR